MLLPSPDPFVFLLQLIYSEYLATSCLVIVSDYNISLFEVSAPIVYLNLNATNFSENLLSVSESGCSNYIVEVGDPLIFMNAFEKYIHLGNTRKSDRKIIFIGGEDEDSRNLTLNVLDHYASKYVANLLLVLPSFGDAQDKECQTFDFITHQFTGSINNDKPLHLGSWNSCQSSSNLTNLFPHDMKDMLGKTLRVATFTYPPYVLLDQPIEKAPSTYDGTEMRTLMEFCRWINCSIEIVPCEEEQWGNIFDNGTGAGVLGHVVEDRADVAIAALYSWYHEYTFLDLSAPVIRTGITCAVPAPSLLASEFIPVRPFSWLIWLLVFLTFVSAALAVTLVQCSLRISSLLAIIGFFIAQPQQESEIEGKRFVVIWPMVFGLVMDSVYGGGLASVLTIPQYEKSIDTVQDLVDSGLSWAATHDAWVFSILLSDEPNMLQLISKFLVLKEDDLKTRATLKDLAYSLERLPAGHYAVGSYITEESLPYLQLMKEDIYWEQCVMMARKSSPYTSKFDELVGRLHSSGILLTWETQVALKYLNFKIQLGIRETIQDKEVESLDFGSVLGVFIFFAIGCLCSFVVFLLEILFGKYKNDCIKS